MQNTEYLKTVSFELAKEALFNCNYLQVKDLVSVGSTEINGTMGQDVDVLALIEMTENMYVFDIDLTDWTIGGSMVLFTEDSAWASFKREVNGVVYNLIVTTDAKMYNDWKTAVEVCKYMNAVMPAGQLLNKDQRCAIHSIVMSTSCSAEYILKLMPKTEVFVPLTTEEIYFRV